jgi:beta-lactamase regulating signal transducer with metallopeptidase domain
MAIPGLIVKGTILLSLLWLAHFALQRAHPALRMAIWRSGTLALILLPVLHLGAPQWRSESTTPIAAPVTYVSEALASQGMTDNATVGATGQVYRAAQPFKAPSLMALAMGIWLLGVGLLLGRHLIAGFEVRSLLARGEPADEGLIARADSIARRIGRPMDFDLRIVESGRSPFISGFLRPVIGIPRDLATSDRDLDAILAHELTHRAGSDHRWAVMIQFTRLLWWPHPLVWGIAAGHRGACEEHSDAVAATYDGDRAWYQSLLARMALTAAAVPPTAAISMLNGSEIMTRLRRLARGENRRPPFRGARILVCALALFVGTTLGTMSLTVPARAAADSMAWAPPPHLVDALTRTDDDASRERALGEMAELLESGDSAKRTQALQALLATAELRLDRSALAGAVRDSLADSDALVQSLAVRTLPIVAPSESDLVLLASLAQDEDSNLREAICDTLYWMPPMGFDAQRDAIILRLMTSGDEKIQREALRATWGHEVSADVEKRMIALAASPGSEYDAVYFGLSTRPRMSEAVVEQLLNAAQRLNNPNLSHRAIWGLAHHDVEPATVQRVHDVLVGLYDSRKLYGSADDVVHFLGRHRCGIGRGKLESITNDEQAPQHLREAAAAHLRADCP